MKVLDGRGLVALATLHHVLQSKRGIVKEKPLPGSKLKGQCTSCKNVTN
jgi:hypothetical protein